MSDIVGTIQAEQDRIIRAPMPGILVVQGGPGTGKTAVALHRAAYLLYSHRDRLKSAGVLLVGPSRSFMKYIERVLPSLGETGVVMSTLGRLMPGIRASAGNRPGRGRDQGPFVHGRRRRQRGSQPAAAAGGAAQARRRGHHLDLTPRQVGAGHATAHGPPASRTTRPA